jgi:redox-sensitive bicupin YhaK (pirin superfamily)
VAVIAGEGKEVRLIVGSLYGETSPVPTFSAMFYAGVRLAPGAKLPVPPEHEERAVYLVKGEIEIAGDRFAGPVLLVLSPGDAVTATACSASRLMLPGGAPMEGPRYIWWNFVPSSKGRIDAAKADWQAGRFDPIPGEEDPVPLPSRG